MLVTQTKILIEMSWCCELSNVHWGRANLGNTTQTAIAVRVRTAPRKLGTKMKYFFSTCKRRRRTPMTSTKYELMYCNT